MGRLDPMERFGHDHILPGHLSDLRHHLGLPARRCRAGLTANDGPSFPAHSRIAAPSYSGNACGDLAKALGDLDCCGIVSGKCAGNEEGPQPRARSALRSAGQPYLHISGLAARTYASSMASSIAGARTTFRRFIMFIKVTAMISSSAPSNSIGRSGAPNP